MAAKLATGTLDALRRLVAYMAKSGVASVHLEDVRKFLGNEILNALIDRGIVVCLDNCYDPDRIKFAVVPKWGRRADVLTYLRMGNIGEIMRRYEGAKAAGDPFAWWIAKLAFSYSFYDRVEVAEYSPSLGATAVRYHIADGVWLISRARRCSRRRCYSYEVASE